MHYREHPTGCHRQLRESVASAHTLPHTRHGDPPHLFAPGRTHSLAAPSAASLTDADCAFLLLFALCCVVVVQIVTRGSTLQ